MNSPTELDQFLLIRVLRLGQTFTAQYDGLQSIDVHLQPNESGSGNLILTLHNDVGKYQVLTNSFLPVRDVKTPGWYKFSLNAQANSNQHEYYYEIKVDGTGSVLVSTAPGDSYLDGALYLNGEPQDSQTAFRMTYNQQLALIGLTKEGVGWFRYLIIAIWLFIIPGWGLLSLLYSDWSRRSWPEKIALAAGTSLAVYPVLFLWTYLFGLNLGAIYAWLPPIAGSNNHYGPAISEK